MVPAIPSERKTPNVDHRPPPERPTKIRAHYLQKLRSTMKMAFLPPSSTSQKREFKTRTIVHIMWTTGGPGYEDFAQKIFEGGTHGRGWAGAAARGVFHPRVAPACRSVSPEPERGAL